MVIAIDSNILVYSYWRECPFHDKAVSSLERLFTSMTDEVAIPWPCLYEFLSIVTHPRVFKNPSPLSKALAEVEHWLEVPGMRLLSEEADVSWEKLKAMLENSDTVGPQIHDAKIANLCLIHRVNLLWTIDRDFSRFPSLRTKNPLV